METTADHTADHTHTVKGPGLARGPAMIIGTILSIAGLALFLHAGDTPTAGFPDGEAIGDSFLGFESNGWTAWITTAAGALLLFGAAQHLLAKAVSAVVGIVLAACAVIALIDGDVLGLAAANWAVELAWAIAALILLLNLLAPRITHTEPVRDADGRARTHDRIRDGDGRTDDRVAPGAYGAPGEATGATGTTTGATTTTSDGSASRPAEGPANPQPTRVADDRPGPGTGPPAGERADGSPTPRDGGDR